MFQKPTPADDDQPVRYRVLSGRTIVTWAVLIVLIGVGMAVWLLLAYTGGNADANRVQLDAIRTAGTIVVGTGGAAALLLAARRQRTAEIALKQKDRDQAHQERVAAATEADAEARRITELYTKAVEQLGSDKAPVRLGGLYALERLAQDNPTQRQTIVNVWCAYLRMPYTLPGEPPDDHADHDVLALYQERVQEREVRLTAQRLLGDHLRLPPPPAISPIQPVAPPASYWVNIDIDLTNAILIDLNFSRCHVRDAAFTQATFNGTARFRYAQFRGFAEFDRTRFDGGAAFNGAQFRRDAQFNGAQFRKQAVFTEAQFNDEAGFYDAQFHGRTFFVKAQFNGVAEFDEAQFNGRTRFGGVRFRDGAPPEVARFLPKSPPAAKPSDEA